MSDGASKDIKEKPRGMTGATFTVMTAFLWALLVGLVIHGFLWYDEGYAVLMKQLTNSYAQQTAMMQQRANLPEKKSRLLHMMADYFAHERIVVMNHTRRWLARAPLLSDAAMNTGVKQALLKPWHFVEDVAALIFLTSKLIVAKCASLLLSIGVFVFAILLGACDGLVARYIRTQEGGRESAFLFHRIADKAVRLPMLCVFLYLASPFFIPPTWVVIFISVLLFSLCRLTTANLKKFV